MPNGNNKISEWYNTREKQTMEGTAHVNNKTKNRICRSTRDGGVRVRERERQEYGQFAMRMRV